MALGTIKYIDSKEWPYLVALQIQESIEKALISSGSCNVMLTGGRSAKYLYQAWINLPNFKNLRGVNFYLSDERWVPLGHPDSNYGMVMKSLFNQGIPEECTFTKINVCESSYADAALAYEMRLPSALNILLLSIGDDGHIASLFPYDKGLNTSERLVTSVTVPKSPYVRLTITPPVIMQADKIYVLAIGAQKKAILKRCMTDPEGVLELPARLVMHGTWFLDHVLKKQGLD